MTTLAPREPSAGPAIDTAAIQRRTVATLMTSQVCAGVGLVSGISVTVLLGDELTGNRTLAGLASACFSIGSAAAAFPLARVMARSGRRPGLRTGYLIGGGGALLALMAALTGQFPLLPIGVTALGAASSANLATRYAAADLAPESRRTSTIGLMVWASTFGAGFGSLISLSILDPAGVKLGLPNYAGSYLATLVLVLSAAAIVQIRLRPDPLVVAGGVGAKTQPRLPLMELLRLILANRQARVAVLTMMLSQATMVGTMALTPLHMKDGHQSGTAISLMLFGHMMGMYVFSPFVGSLADRIGRYPVLLGAGVLCTAGAVTAGLTPSHDFAGLAVGQALVGLAWCFGIIAASGLLTDSFPVQQRASIQGFGDLCMSGSGALAGVAAGGVVAVWGYAELNLGAAVLGVIIVLAVVLTGWSNRASRVDAVSVG